LEAIIHLEYNWFGIGSALALARRPTMLVDDKTRKALEKALDIKKLPIPKGLVVTKVVAEDYTDSTGEPSLRVLVVLDESVDVEKVTGEAVGDLKMAISDKLIKHGVTLFPYIFLAKPSELAETDED
jgi:hypothetical protein